MRSIKHGRETPTSETKTIGSENMKNEKTNKAVLQMRFRDLRNGVSKIVEKVDGTLKMNAQQWTTLSGLFLTMATLWESIVETNEWTGKHELKVVADLKETAVATKRMAMTPSERKAHAQKVKDAQKALADAQKALIDAMGGDLL